MREYSITEDEYRHAQRLHVGWRNRVVFVSSWVIASAAFLVKEIHEADGGSYTTAVVFSGVLAVALFVLLPLELRRRHKAIYSEHKGLHRPATVSFDDRFAEFTSDAGHARIAWRDFTAFKEDDTMFLLYEARNLMRVIPKRVFESDREMASFRAGLGNIKARRSEPSVPDDA
jgi:hypothetical protein